MLTDSHAHLDDARFAADREALIQRAWDAGVRRILTIGNGTGPDDMGCGIPVRRGLRLDLHQRRRTSSRRVEG